MPHPHPRDVHALHLVSCLPGAMSQRVSVMGRLEQLIADGADLMAPLPFSNKHLGSDRRPKTITITALELALATWELPDLARLLAIHPFPDGAACPNLQTLKATETNSIRQDFEPLTPDDVSATWKKLARFISNMPPVHSSPLQHPWTAWMCLLPRDLNDMDHDEPDWRDPNHVMSGLQNVLAPPVVVDKQAWESTLEIMHLGSLSHGGSQKFGLAMLWAVSGVPLKEHTYDAPEWTSVWKPWVERQVLLAATNNPTQKPPRPKAM